MAGSSLKKPSSRSAAQPDRPASLVGHRAASAVVSLTGAEEGLDPSAVGWLDRHARMVVEHLGVGGDCRIRLAGDDEVAKAHSRHLGVPGTTDVITFDLSDPADAGARVFLDADLLVCVDEARRQSARRGTTVEQELLLYIVHGMLHCLGHDDHSDADARKMHLLEDEILLAVGVGPVYNRRGPDPRVGDA